MIKSLLVGIQFIGILILSTYTSKDVKVHHTAPIFAMLGEEVEVTVFFEKGKIDGFAKYQVNVPDGMTVTPGDINGASFTFKEGEAKFIWIALPQESDFEISYTLTIEQNCKLGNNDLEQWFSYLEKNERKTTVLPLHVIEVAGEDVSNAHVSEGLAKGTRTITQLNDDHYVVEIDLYKDGIKGFAKLQEILPNGMSAQPVKKASGVFTQLDDKVKIVWFSIPEQENLKIVYELFPTEPITDKVEINGEFTFLKENETKMVAIEQGTYKSMERAVVSETSTTGNEPEVLTDSTEESSSPSTTDPVTAALTETVEASAATGDASSETVESENVSDQITADTSSSESVPEPVETASNSEVVVGNLGDLTSVPSPDTGVTYRVQIVAGKNVVDDVYFKTRHKFSQTFDIENHKGWIKYTTGTHTDYKEARDRRVYINNNYNFDGPFVTAYNDGVRITVQEALMITRQTWYQ